MEKHVLSIEKNGKLDLIAQPFDKEFNAKNETIVILAVPLLPFMLLSFPIAIVVTSIFVNYFALILSF